MASSVPPSIDLARFPRALDNLKDLIRWINSLASTTTSKLQFNVIRQHQAYLEHFGAPVDFIEDAAVRVGKRIGTGTFSAIFEAEMECNKGKFLRDSSRLEFKPVAIKFELQRMPQLLRNEIEMYSRLVGCHGFPKIYIYGKLHMHNVMAMELLGPSLETLFQKCEKRFSCKTVGIIAKQMLTRIQCVHEAGIIFRDVKPDNLLIGLRRVLTQNTIYMTDFGLADVYTTGEPKTHILQRTGQRFIGTARYMSLNAHQRLTLSRRDDLESLAYMLIYFLRGSLPWQACKLQPLNTGRPSGDPAGLGPANVESNAIQRFIDHYNDVYKMKQEFLAADHSQELPKEIIDFLNYTRSLGFDETPDYNYMQSLFTNLLAGRTGPLFDWIEPGPWFTAAPPAHSEAPQAPHAAQSNGSMPSSAAVVLPVGQSLPQPPLTNPPMTETNLQASTMTSAPPQPVQPTPPRPPLSEIKLYVSGVQMVLRRIQRHLSLHLYRLYDASYQRGIVSAVFADAVGILLKKLEYEVQEMSNRILLGDGWLCSYKVIGPILQLMRAAECEFIRVVMLHVGIRRRSWRGPYLRLVTARRGERRGPYIFRTAKGSYRALRI